ncbi:MAG: deoxyguanosinetriphosphate triphosphohydrolase [Hyphomicrobium sp.]|nr:deoxyguanosinetriphosphate triphosphohydrolase [Hyphomicrobium sp.]MBN9279032.1 deoxyguanosinetriphosphate triphosphohydrolase [Hyphomicrobium sp.]
MRVAGENVAIGDRSSQDVPNEAPVPRRPGARRVVAWALEADASRGRAVPEPPCPMRTPFQRDRDRIVHATAFRRLTYKTQVFLHHEGDHFRTRLTHSLEVAQIARSMARQLELDEDLAEALSLAHDVGHPPFGHAGERALDLAMRAWGGFDHNAHSLRMVTSLERRYARFDGLNLTFETLEGLAKHNGPLTGPHAAPNAAERNRELLDLIAALGLTQALELDRFAAAEAQVAAIADDIAYTNHDIDDALRAGLISIADLEGAPMASAFVTAARAVLEGTAIARGPIDRDRRLFYEVNRRMITAMVDDVVKETRVRVAALAPQNADDIRNAGMAVVAFPEASRVELDGLRKFLFYRVYRAPRVMRVMHKAEEVVAALFDRYLNSPADLPGGRGEAVLGLDPAGRARRIADFIAGMTDRFALAEYARLFDDTIDLH